MPADVNSTLFLLARLLLGGAFVIFAYRNLTMNVARLTGLIAEKVPMAREVVLIGIALQFVGGLLVAVGPWAPIGASMLIVFLVLATVLFHPMWAYQGEERGPHTFATIMNSCLCGAFLLVMATTL